MPSATASSPLDKHLQSLAAGFDALQDEYQRLWTHCQSLQSSLDAAKTQYASLTSQCPHKAEPLLLPDPVRDATPTESSRALVFSAIPDSSQRDKVMAACRLSQQIRILGLPTSNGVTIHSGPSADKLSAPNSSAMPSISESPLEQDFTVAGTPSRLDCPFASMTNRRLSSHAASIVSRYRPGTATPKSSVSRVNGRASSVARASITDPIKAETCGMASPNHQPDVEASVQGSTGVCPIRFLDQHSPEVVAAYFESHKHELPRSHEVCVKRYQSNEESIKELDAKYGNLVSMIQGLGQKHVSMLPDTPGDGEEDMDEDHLSAEKIRKWASSVGTNAAEVDLQDDYQQHEEEEEEDRQQRFDRPLKDIRLGESPSRPWGIQVPIHVNRHASYASTAPVLAHGAADVEQAPRLDVQPEKPRGRCPFGFDAADQKVNAETHRPKAAPMVMPAVGQCPAPGPQIKVEAQVPEAVPRAAPSMPEAKSIPRPTFINPPLAENDAKHAGAMPQMVFTGPVFIGYSLEDALKLLHASQESGGAGDR